MKRILTFFLCLMLLSSCVLCAFAQQTTASADATEVNTGPDAGNAFFIFALILAVGGMLYLFFKLRKRD